MGMRELATEIFRLCHNSHLEVNSGVSMTRYAHRVRLFSFRPGAVVLLSAAALPMVIAPKWDTTSGSDPTNK